MSEAGDRLLGAIRRVIREEFPALSFAGLYAYTVETVDAGAGVFDASPEDVSLGLPTLAGLTVRGGILADTSTPKAGTEVLVEFIDADPRRPVIVSVGPAIVDGAVDATTELALGPSAKSVMLGGGVQEIARKTDACVVYFDAFTPLVLAGAVTTFGGTPVGPFVGTLAVFRACPGTITSGSAKVSG
jgi:hypothetical protein